MMDERRTLATTLLLLHLLIATAATATDGVNRTDLIEHAATLNDSARSAQELERRSLGHRSCDVELNARESVLLSPGYPSAYPSNADCVYVVRRVWDSCRLRLTFHRFRLEPSDGCSRDYLLLDADDGRRRLCAALPPNHTLILPFTRDTINIRFRSNAIVDAAGFFISAQQLGCGWAESQATPTNICDRTFSQPDFQLTSPAHPAPHPHDVDCLYAIRKSSPDVCVLQISVISWDLQMSSDCERSFVEWNRQRFCSPTPPTSQFVPFQQSVFYVRFRSGFNAERRSGFRLHVQQRTCTSPFPPTPPPLTPPFPLTPPPLKPSFFPTPPPLTPPFPLPVCGWLDRPLRSEGGGAVTFELILPPSYPPHSRCVKRISRASNAVCALEMTVRTFDVDDGDNCVRQHFAVDGRRFCRRLAPGTTRLFNFFHPEMTLSFQSDERVSGGGGGFSLMFVQRSNCFVTPTPSLPPAPCPMTFAAAAFVLTSPETDDVDCDYVIKKFSADVCAVTLSFALFRWAGDVLWEGGKEGLCSGAHLDINGVQRLCSAQLEGSSLSYAFDGEFFVIRLRSGSNRQPHFRIDVAQKRCGISPGPPRPLPPGPPHPLAPGDTDCPSSGVVRGKWIRLTSPQVPVDRRLRCVYVLLKASLDVCQLTVRVTAFALDCRSQALLFDQHKMCGMYRRGFTRSFEFSRNQLTIQFASESLNAGEGFDLELTQLECLTPPTPYPYHPPTTNPPPYYPPTPYPPPYQPLCNRTIRRDRFQLRVDRRWPCDYVICKVSDHICHLEIEFKNVATAPDCSSHYVEVGGVRQCTHIRRYAFSASVVHLRIVVASMALLDVRQLPCSANEMTQAPPVDRCNRVVDQPQFAWTSPNYPLPYHANLRCSLTVKKTDPSVCSLDIQLVYFSLESSLGCVKDHVDIMGRKLCGEIQQQQTSVAFIENDEIILRFNSDAELSGNGFYFTFHQRPCQLNGPVFKRQMEPESVPNISRSVSVASKSVTAQRSIVISGDSENVTLSTVIPVV